MPKPTSCGWQPQPRGLPKTLPSREPNSRLWKQIWRDSGEPCQDHGVPVCRMMAMTTLVPCISVERADALERDVLTIRASAAADVAAAKAAAVAEEQQKSADLGRERAAEAAHKVQSADACTWCRSQPMHVSTPWARAMIWAAAVATCGSCSRPAAGHVPHCYWIGPCVATACVSHCNAGLGSKAGGWHHSSGG
jgi:hypothetical protein